MSGNEQANGILPVQQLRQAIEAGIIAAENDIEAAQTQPASLDLRLGSDAWRVQASFLPGRGMSVTDKLEKFAMHRIDLSDGAVLERGCVYIVRLQESLCLPPICRQWPIPKARLVGLIFSRA